MVLLLAKGQHEVINQVIIGSVPLTIKPNTECTSMHVMYLLLDWKLLFLVGLCGLAGFTSIARPEWLPWIVSWQAPSGCYHRFLEEDFNMENFNPIHYGNYRKRSESAMSPGPQMCLSHRTSVALVALTAYIRKLIEDEASLLFRN